MNVYSYATGQPTFTVDPDGLQGCASCRRVPQIDVAPDPPPDAKPDGDAGNLDVSLRVRSGVSGKKGPFIEGEVELKGKPRDWEDLVEKTWMFVKCSFAISASVIVRVAKEAKKPPPILIVPPPVMSPPMRILY